MSPADEGLGEVFPGVPCLKSTHCSRMRRGKFEALRCEARSRVPTGISAP